MSEEDTIVREEVEKEDWDSINDKHKKRYKELKRRVGAQTRWQRIVSKQKSERHSKQRHRESMNIPKDQLNYINGKLISPKWALDYFPNMILVRNNVTGETYSICPFDSNKCELDDEHAGCMYCSRNNEEYLEGRYKK